MVKTSRRDASYMTHQTIINKKDIKEQVLRAMNFRHATKIYDENKKVSEEDFNYILEAGQLSPSSLGSEPWKFLVVQDPQIRAKMMDVSPGAVEKLKTASHFVVILARKGVRYDSEYLQHQMKAVQQFPADMLEMITEQYKHFQAGEDLLDNERSLDDWSAKQTYIALGNMLTAAAMIGVDSTPMEGFRTKELDALLAKEGLIDRQKYSASVLAAFGYRKEDPNRPKTRAPLEQIVEWV